MGKSRTKKSRRQDLVVVNATTVQIPLPLQAALEDAESAFFGLCAGTGKQVLAAMMEPDRTALCGPPGRHDTARQAVRGGSTESAIVLGGRGSGCGALGCDRGPTARFGCRVSRPPRARIRSIGTRWRRSPRA